MLAHPGIEHQDVIRIIGSSPNSFDEAVRNGINTIKEGHRGTPRAKLIFTSFEVVQLQGTVEDSEDHEEPKVALYQAVIDVVGHHHHDH